jgi:glycosyltransferase involved in cell wall biosynthesis
MNNIIPVIMAVKDRLELTRQTVDTLFAHTDSTKIKLFIVSDASSNETNDYLKTLEDRAKVIYMEVGMCAPACKNAAISILDDYEYLYFTDNDMYFGENWLEVLVKIMENFPRVGIVGGRNHPYHGVIGYQEEAGIRIQITYQQPAFSMLVRRKVWLEHGPFIHFENTGLGKDDVRFCDSVRNAGWDIAQPTTPVVFHCGIKNTFNLDTAGAEVEKQQHFPPDAIVK